jgi:hypothetical protein
MAPRPPPTPPPVSKLDRRSTGRLKKRDNLLTGQREGEGVGEEPNHTTARMPGIAAFTYELWPTLNSLERDRKKTRVLQNGVSCYGSA